MDNAELLRKIESEARGDRVAPEPTVEATRYLVFRTEDTHYALPSPVVREVITDVPKFFVPFVPPYVQGLINRQGEPYTVVDLTMFLTQRRLDASTYLVLNVPNEQVALLISHVVEILPVAASDIRALAATGDADEHVTGVFELGEVEVLILNADSILARLRSEVGRE